MRIKVNGVSNFESKKWINSKAGLLIYIVEVIAKECHGLAGSTSHAAKVDVKQDLLNFVDINSQPNGCSAAESSSATHYFLLKF